MARRLFFDVIPETDGAYVVTLPLRRPAVRDDDEGGPWTHVRVEEAATADPETWTPLVDFGEILPLDTDPSKPAGLYVTVAGATLPAGWYRLTLFDANSATAGPEEPISLSHTRLPPAPSLTQVAALMLHRLVDEDGEPIAAWNDSTTPTADEVEAIIEHVRLEVATKITVGIPARQAAAAQAVVAMGVVAVFEQSKHAIAVSDGDSSFATSRTIYLGQLADLEKACRNPAYPLVR